MKNKSIFLHTIMMYCGLLITTASHTITTYSVIPAEQSNYKVIIFDLGDVFITYSMLNQMYVFIPVVLQNPLLLYYMPNIYKAKESYFEILRQIPSSTSYNIYNKNKPMPPIFSDWMCSITSLQDLQKIICDHINQSTHPNSVKALFHAINKSMLNASWLSQSQTTISDMMQLAINLRNAGYTMYILSNWDSESFALIKKQYQQFFNLFDGIVISGNEKIPKPHPDIFKIICSRYGLNPQKCIFIDDEPHNVQTAQELGMSGIIHTSTQETLNQLSQYGILHI